MNKRGDILCGRSRLDTLGQELCNSAKELCEHSRCSVHLARGWANKRQLSVEKLPEESARSSSSSTRSTHSSAPAAAVTQAARAPADLAGIGPLLEAFRGRSGSPRIGAGAFLRSPYRLCDLAGSVRFGSTRRSRFHSYSILRRHGRRESSQARAGQRRASVHGRHDPGRVPEVHREGPRAGSGVGISSRVIAGSSPFISPRRGTIMIKFD